MKSNLQRSVVWNETECPATVPFPKIAIHQRQSGVPAWSRAAVATSCLLATAWIVTGIMPLPVVDLWNHLNQGRLILESGSLAPEPTRAAAAGEYGPWSSQIALFLVYELAGPEGLLIGRSLIAAAVCGLWLVALNGRGVPLLLSTGIAAAGFVLSIPMLGGLGPYLIGWLCMAILLCQLSGKEPLRFWHVQVLLLFAAWSNAHASFLFGLAVLSLHLAADAIAAFKNRQLTGNSPTRCSFAFAIGGFAAAIFGSCLHPLGPAVLWEAGNAAIAGQLAVEPWAGPLVLTSIRGLLFFASLLAIAWCLRKSPRPFSRIEIALLLSFAAATLVHSGMLLWWASIWVWVLGPHLAYLARTAIQFGEALERNAWTNMLAGTGVILIALIWSPTSSAWMRGTLRQEPALLADDAPFHFAKEIRQQQLNGRAFCPAVWSDYIAFQGGNRLQSMVTSTDEYAQPALWRDYQAISTASAAWFDVIKFHDLRYLVLRAAEHAPLANLIRRDGRFRILYEDRAGMIVEVASAGESRSRTPKR